MSLPSHLDCRAADEERKARAARNRFQACEARVQVDAKLAAASPITFPVGSYYSFAAQDHYSCWALANEIADQQATDEYDTAAAIAPGDVVLEPSAGTGMLAIYAELSGGGLILNELADTRARLLESLFPATAPSRRDAAQINDYLDPAVRPSVVLMNPPFSVAAHVDGQVSDAALRHLSSALARPIDGGRLVAIIGATLSPDNPTWRDAFNRAQLPEG